MNIHSSPESAIYLLEATLASVRKPRLPEGEPPKISLFGPEEPPPNGNYPLARLSLLHHMKY